MHERLDISTERWDFAAEREKGQGFWVLNVGLVKSVKSVESVELVELVKSVKSVDGSSYVFSMPLSQVFLA